MIYIHIFAFLTLFGILFTFSKLSKAAKISLETRIFYIILAVAFLTRCICAYFYQGFTSDTACFAGWSTMAYENGLSNFYTSDAFTDYPPGFIYILYVLGAIMSWCKIPYLSGMCLLLLKLPAIICDMITGYLVYKIAHKFFKEPQAVLLACMYLFNPAVFLNSSIWGQVDAVFTLGVILICYFMTEQKTVSAYITFGISVLIKPQTLVFTPILIYGIVDEVLRRDFSWRRFFHNFTAGLCVIFCMILACMPFGLDNVITQYTSTLGSYPYIAVNAFNFWGFFGLNWISQDEKLIFCSYEQWGTVIILLIVLFATLLFFRARQNAARYFTTAAFLIISMFLFSVRMHERYLFPALALLLFAYILRPAKEIGLCYAGFSMLHFYNTAYILFFYDPTNYDRKAPLFLIVSALMVACGIFYYHTLYRYDVAKIYLDTRSGMEFYSRPTIRNKKTSQKRRESSPYVPRPSEKPLPFIKVDWYIMLAITIVYGAVALYDLGDMSAPQTEYLMHEGDSITLYLTEYQDASSLYFYNGCYEERQFTLETKVSEEDEWQYSPVSSSFSMGSVFKWNSVSLPEGAKYFRLTCTSDVASIMELAFADAENNHIMAANAPEYPNLFDEKDTFPDAVSFRNGTYFDEIYHARTAYEYLHDLTTYETTHPPLGKILIALGVALFGMTPFGWRIAGTFFGILMLPVIYLIGRTLTKDRALAGFATVLLAFDFMHFTQTRIATIDVFVTFFIILMYYFMYRYCSMSFYDTKLYKTFIPLGACGITMGFAIASKWTGVYAAVGLAVLFFATLYRRYQEYRYIRRTPNGSSNGIQHYDILMSFVPKMWKTIAFCFVFFVIVPFIIYLLSYIPFESGESGLFAKMWSNQELMLSYHSGLVATHPYSSNWYEWPTMIRPIFYYSGIISDTATESLRQGISAFGNPMIWWVGIPAFIYMIYLALGKKDKIAGMLCVSYLAQYLPWCLVSRLTFIYHYFPSVPFVVLMIMYAACKLKKNMSDKHFLNCLLAYSAVTIALFCLFYPVLSGQTVSVAYVDKFLRWFDSWVLIYG